MARGRHSFYTGLGRSAMAPRRRRRQHVGPLPAATMFRRGPLYGGRQMQLFREFLRPGVRAAGLPRRERGDGRLLGPRHVRDDEAALDAAQRAPALEEQRQRLPRGRPRALLRAPRARPRRRHLGRDAPLRLRLRLVLAGRAWRAAARNSSLGPRPQRLPSAQVRARRRSPNILDRPALRNTVHPATTR